MAAKKNLVIVESPAKAKTIEKILGDKFQVMASVGHVIDLPQKKLGVDVEDNFKPSYSIIKGKEEIIDKLKKKAKNSKEVYLASDPDREGEAIAWHIANALNLDETKNNRIEFHEITEKAIKKSIEKPRTLDMNMVNAQQARRILDRLVGYEISPLLWKQLGPVSAGRVQSVTLKLICALEDRIKKFVPVKFWSINGEFSDNLKLSLYKVEQKKVDKITDEKIVKKIKKLEKKEFEVTQANIKHKSKNPPNPLKTSTLQQLSSSYLGFSASKTMRVAQSLYEGIDIDGAHKGLITYMRTDSIRISEVAQEMAREYILENLGEKYLGHKKSAKTKQKIQDAHEGVRPTDINLTPEILKKSLNLDQYKLYKLIWERFLISQLAPMKYDQFEIILNCDKIDFRGTINKITFDGYYKIFKDEEDLPIGDFPNIQTGDKKILEKLNIKEDFTKAPARFTESSIVKKLESEGIGRPSTYASIIETLKKRAYVVLENKSIVPTELGYQIKDILDKNFTDIMNVKFTASLEDELDDVASGEMDWISLLSKFYTGLKEDIDKYNKKLEEEAKKLIISDVDCACGLGKMIVKSGRWGKYLSCPKTKKEGGCKARISLKEIEINPEELEKGEIFVKEKVDKLLEEKKGKLTDVITDTGSRYLLKNGRFGDYLESEKYEEDNLRIPLPSEIRKMIKDGNVEVKDGIYQLKSKLDKVQVAGVRATDIKRDGVEYVLKSGRFGDYLESVNYKKDKLRISLPPDIKKALKAGNIEIKDDVFLLNSAFEKIEKENQKLIDEAGLCEKCGKPFKVGYGRWGKFLACTGYPKCKNIRKITKSKKEKE